MRTTTSARGAFAYPMLGPAVTAGFALLAAAGTTEIWVHRFAAADAGTDYRRGLATLAAAIALAAVCGARALRRIAARRFFAAAFPLAMVALAMPLWVYADIIGRADPAVFKPELARYITHDETLEGGTGIWMAAAAATCAIATLCWQFLARQRILTAARPPLTGPSIAAAFAFFAAFGSAAPWSSGFRWSELGVEHTPGAVALVAAGVALIVCGLRAHGRIDRGAYATLGLVAGAVMFAAPLFFYNTTVGDPDPYYARRLIDCLGVCGHIHAAAGLYVTVVGALGFGATLLVDLSAKRGEAEPGRSSMVAGRWTT